MTTSNSTLEGWNEIRTAFHVARLGTLTAAGAHLGIHHSTVIRHINTLEAQLGIKLFYRHARGYSPTDAGKDLLQTTAATEDQLLQLMGRLQGENQAIRGEITLTTTGSSSRFITPFLVEFQRIYKDIKISLITDEHYLKLEYGEAHIALRLGTRPDDPDYVVQPLAKSPISLFARKDYVEQYGVLNSRNIVANHRFVMAMPGAIAAPFRDWIAKNVPESSIVFQASDFPSLENAILEGAGIGFMSVRNASLFPDLVQMMPARPEWSTVLWLVTHVDIHRTAKVQALLSFFKERIRAELNQM